MATNATRIPKALLTRLRQQDWKAHWFAAKRGGSRLRVRAIAVYRVLALSTRADWARRWQELRAIQPREAWREIRVRLEDAKLQRRAVYLAALVMAFVAADTAALLADWMVPEPPPVPIPYSASRPREQASIEIYRPITERNVFSSLGIIPDEKLSEGMARRTRLPFNLIGTMVLEDPESSIATLQDTSENRVYPAQVGETIAGKIEIRKIDEFRVFFTNLSSGDLEYVAMPEKPGLPQTAQFEAPLLSGVQKKGDSGVSQIDESHFEVEHSALDRSLGNLSEVLQQARAIPNFENGMMSGYKIVQIARGSVYDQLGIKDGDVITAFNGSPVTDPGKAMALLNEVKSMNQISIAIKRGTRSMTLNYVLR